MTRKCGLFAAFCVTLGLNAAVGAADNIVLPDIGGDSSQSVLSSSAEKEIGARFMRELRTKVSVIDDPEIVEYIDALGYRLAAHSGEETLDFTFFVVEHNLINAFAAPGGYIGINSGLITATQSESELAAVLAHEIAHVTQRHLARSLELQSRSNVPILAGLIAAVLIGTQNAEAGVGVAAAVQGGAVQAMLDFSRSNEQEADRVGIQTLAAAELDPRAMPVFFERLHEASRYYASPPEFLSTHPVTTSRIAESTARAEQYPYRQFEDSLSYHLVRSKIKVYSHDKPEEALAHFREVVAKGKSTNALGAEYGLALSLYEAGHYDEARAATFALIDQEPERISFYRLLADIEARAGNIEEALFVYEDNLELYPQDRSLMRGYADALVRSGRAKQAIRALNSYSRGRDLDQQMHKIAARAYEALGDLRSSHASLGEHYYLLGNLSRATHQLELAKRAPSSNDYYANARLEARLEQMRGELNDRERQ